MDLAGGQAQELLRGLVGRSRKLEINQSFCSVAPTASCYEARSVAAARRGAPEQVFSWAQSALGCGFQGQFRRDRRAGWPERFGQVDLVKVLTGIYEPDPGARVTLQGPRGEQVSGLIHVIHQDLGLIPQLSAVENIDLSRSYGARVVLPTNWRAETQCAQERLAGFDATLDVSVPVAALTPAERTIVAIARALDGWECPDGLLIVDEPTTALHRDEVNRDTGEVVAE